jgi:hypothetical protein
MLSQHNLFPSSFFCPTDKCGGNLKNKNLLSLDAVSFIISGFANVQKNTMRTYNFVKIMLTFTTMRYKILSLDIYL